MKSFLAVPLVCLGEVIGLLEVDSSQRDAFDEVDRTALELDRYATPAKEGVNVRPLTDDGRMPVLGRVVDEPGLAVIDAEIRLRAAPAASALAAGA